MTVHSSPITDLFQEILLINTTFSRHQDLIAGLITDYQDHPTKENLAQALKNHQELNKDKDKKNDKKIKELLKEEQNVICAIFLFLSIRYPISSDKMPNDNLLLKHPWITEEYPNLTIVEMKYLENYYFYLKYFLLLVKDKGISGYLLDVPSLFEGSNKSYIRGGLKRQTYQTSVRVKISKEEAGIKTKARLCKRKKSNSPSLFLPVSSASTVSSISALDEGLIRNWTPLFDFEDSCEVDQEFLPESKKQKRI